MMSIFKHLPALQVLLPFFAALTATLCKSAAQARAVAIIAIGLDLLLSILGWVRLGSSMLYNFGDWSAQVGIEYRLDNLNQPIIIYLNALLLFFLLFCHQLTKVTILEFIKTARQPLFYSILLFAHSGYLAIASTNDLFHLYVAIEVSSLCTYVLIAQGSHPKAVVGAFDYLIMGTIAATFILIGIGFLLSYTGNLNMTVMHNYLQGTCHARLVIVGASFIILGSILKTAFFPLHFWMVRAYLAAPPIILTYLASISGIIGIYIIFRFLHFVIDYQQIIAPLAIFLRPISLVAIIFCSYFAFKAKGLRQIIIYSSAVQVGYAFLLIAIQAPEHLIIQFLAADGINKIALFLIVAYLENPYSTLPITLHPFWRIMMVISLICNAGLPISGMFIIKVRILDLLLAKEAVMDFAIIAVSSALALLYYYQIASKLLFEKINIISPKNYSLALVNLGQLLILILVIQYGS